jgi:hypothetical protein
MRTNIDIDDALMAEAQKASGLPTKKQTVEQALRLMIRLRQQQEVDVAFGKYRWRGNLGRSRKGRGPSSSGSTSSMAGMHAMFNYCAMPSGPRRSSLEI